MKKKYWVIVPAAGSGQRLGVELPKQYLELAGQKLIEHTLGRLLKHPQLVGICVALADNDPYWSQTQFHNHEQVHEVTGGETRAHSVMNALRFLADGGHGDEWVLIHDAARPCVSQQDISRLIETVEHTDIGAILATPITDTVKQVDDSAQVTQTLSRDQLWRALTPQMFRLDQLFNAIKTALENGLIVTDEASAMEQAGYAVTVVKGNSKNIKVTLQEDLPLAAFYLSGS
jgi:2-C-methyl-D-erythritol 4-phosphate cytidylyltransferase